MQPLVLECEPCRGDDAVEQLALVEQRRIVHEHADATVLAVDGRRCAELGGVERPAFDVDVARQIRQPVAELQLGIAERLPQRIAKPPGRRHRSELREQPPDRGTREAAAQEPRGERERDEQEGDAAERREDRPPQRAEKRVDDQLGADQCDRERARQQHEPEAAPVDGRGCAPPADEEDHRRGGDRDRADRGHDGQHLLSGAAVDDRERARRAVATAGLVGRDEQVCGREADRGGVGEDDDPLRAARQRPGRVGEQEVDERREEDLLQRPADARRQRGVGKRERAGEVEEADQGEEGAGAVAGAAPGAEEARGRERQADQLSEERIERRRIRVVARQRERQRAAGRDE